jgi:hypothetical protein
MWKRAHLHKIGPPVSLVACSLFYVSGKQRDSQLIVFYTTWALKSTEHFPVNSRNLSVDKFRDSTKHSSDRHFYQPHTISTV